MSHSRGYHPHVSHHYFVFLPVSLAEASLVVLLPEIFTIPACIAEETSIKSSPTVSEAFGLGTLQSVPRLIVNRKAAIVVTFFVIPHLRWTGVVPCVIADKATGRNGFTRGTSVDTVVLVAHTAPQNHGARVSVPKRACLPQTVTSRRW